MTRFTTLLEGLVSTLTDAAEAFERGAHWRAALLWPDPESQFATVYDRLRAGLAPRELALYKLGTYDPKSGSGPAIWLRCLLDAAVDVSPPPNSVPVFLLPGVSSAELRHPQTLDKLLRPLAELQYRGDVFRNRRQARDWTVGSFIRSPEQGLDLEVATDSRTDEAATAALSTLLTYPLADLPARRLVAEDFQRLIEPDEVRALLDWIADPIGVRAARGANWDSLRALVKAKFTVDLDAKGARQIAVERLAKGEGVWSTALARVDDAPEKHRIVCEELRRAESKQLGLPGFSEGTPGTSADNVTREQVLEAELKQAADLPHHEAIARILTLEDAHASRRKSRWARLGEAPLARSLEPLARLAVEVRTPLAGADALGLAQAYADGGYAADSALLDALASAGPHAAVVGEVARALYWPWVNPLATRFREALETGGFAARATPIVVTPGTFVLFVDGLRLDLGQRLLERLIAYDTATFTWRLSPIPTVTATAKPLVTPVADAIRGVGRADVFLPLESSSGKPADTACLLAAMRVRGVDVLVAAETRGPSSHQAIGWSECGHLDRDGHSMGERLAGQVEGEIEAIAHRVQALRRAGWARVRVVTDHGWLLVPKGLPKASIPASTLQATAWSRVARLTEGSAPEAATLPWHYDATVRIAVPPGAHAFRAGEAYAHGGVSLQECVVLDILVGDMLGSGRASSGGNIRIVSVAWKRYRLTVMLDRDASGCEVEIRRDTRNPDSRVKADQVGGEGNRLELRIDGDLDEETTVVVVLIDAHGSILDSRTTAIGVN